MITFKEFLAEETSPVLQKLYDSIKEKYPHIGPLEHSMGDHSAELGYGVMRRKKMHGIPGKYTSRYPFYLAFYKEESAIKQMIDDDDPKMQKLRGRVNKEKWKFDLMYVVDTRMGETDGVPGGTELSSANELAAVIKEADIEFTSREDDDD